MQPINSHAKEPEPTALEAAQQRLAKACAAMPMNPVGAAISAYVNSTVASARIDALTELWLEPPNATWSRQEALDAALVRHLTRRAEQLEAEAYDVPGILRAN